MIYSFLDNKKNKKKYLLLTTAEHDFLQNESNIHENK